MLRGFIGFILIGLLVQCKTDVQPTIKKTGNPALDQLNTALAKDSTDVTALFDRAQLYYDVAFYDGAIADLERAIDIDSTQAPFYHLLADAYLDYYRSKEAVLTMEKCMTVFPKRIPSLLKLSEIQMILKQHDESLATCSRILSINDQSADAYFMMGMNLRAMGQIDRAKVAFARSTEIDPELYDSWILLGQIFEDESNEKALDYYEAAIQIDPENPTGWHSKAYFLQNNDRISEAIEIYKRLHIVDKDYLDAYLNAGILYLSMDSVQQAFKEFDILVNIKPGLDLGHYYRGLAYAQMGNKNAAIQDYQSAIKLNSNNQQARAALDAIANDAN